MATVLFAWELGGGLGHLLQILPLAEGMSRRGHQVYVALRHLNAAAAAEVFGRCGVRFLQAPYSPPAPPRVRPTHGFAQLLANVGFGDDRELLALASAWRNLFRLVRPDLVVFDHSPSALLASRAGPSRRVLLGTGFFCPPDGRPFAPLRAGTRDDQGEAVLAAEDHVLANVNRLLSHWKLAPLDRLARLYADVDDTFLTTFPELDHYGTRAGLRYRGPVNGSGGKPIAWPGGGKRVYA